MIVRFGKQSLFAIAVSSSIAACETSTADLGPEFVEVTAAQTAVYFEHPSFSGGYSNYFKGRARDSGEKISLGAWAAADGYPRAELSLLEAPGAFLFTRQMTLAEVAESWNALADAAFIGEEIELANAYGVVIMKQLTANGFPCVALIQRFASSGLGVGTRVLHGYYCDEAGRRMTRRVLREIAGGIRLN